MSTLSIDPPSLDALNEHESQFHYAAQAIALAAGFTNVRMIGDTAALPDEFLYIRFRRTGATGARILLPNGREEYHQFTGMLEAMHGLRRDQNVESTVLGVVNRQGDKRGKLRTLFSVSAQSFTEGFLPWLAVTDIVPGPSNYGTDRRDDGEWDISTESFVLTYEVRPEAYAAVIPVPAP